MEPLKRCALLALALLQVVVLAEELRCDSEGERAGCRVVRDGGSSEPTLLECAPRTTYGTDGETNNKTFPNNCNANDTTCEVNASTVTVDDHQGVGNYSISALGSALNSHLRRNNVSEVKSDLLSQATVIEVNILSSVSVLDLSNFPSAKTVIVNTYGFNIQRVCGANKISNFTVKSPSMVNLSFVSSLSNLKFLNLSWNNIKTFPNTKLPPLVLSIDLSFNNISLHTNYSLPESLRSLNISYNNISNNDGFILNGNVIVLDIRGNKLSRVPVIEIHCLEELYLSYNDITTLKGRVFMGLLNLTILDLRGNRMIMIDEKSFQGLNRLQWLDLSENNLISLAPATFQYLSNLVTLLLSKNENLGKLQDFEDASLLFGTGQRLQEIEASGTNLSKIPSTVTRSVRKLLLTDNSICTIQCGEVDSFPLLQVIDVSNNMISEIEEDALGRLEFLTDLILAGNRLVNIPKSLPNQLQILDLRCNRIKRLNNIDFLGLQKLRVLLLSMNNISVVEDGSFGQLINLDVLDLSYNPIKSLYRSSFTGPRRLKELYLISITDLTPLTEPLSFPAPESSHLEVLNLDSSPELATRLMDDVAALTMFHELSVLSLKECELHTIRNDLQQYLPRLHRLYITNNPLNCTDIKWLVSWLQSLNSFKSEMGNIRRDIYIQEDSICEGLPEPNIICDGNVTCAASEGFQGKAVTPSPEENQSKQITELFTMVATEVLLRELTTETLTETTSLEVSTNYSFEQTSSPSTLVAESDPPPSVINKQPEVIRYSSDTTESYEYTTVSPIKDLINMHKKRSNTTNAINSTNKLQKTWKYYKNKSKYAHSTPEPFIILLNDTNKTVKVTDNQINDSISSGAFLAHEPPPSSHPGMMVFLFIVGVILVASSAMVYSHCAQLRRSSQYHHQQDIEVSSFGGNELW